MIAIDATWTCETGGCSGTTASTLDISASATATTVDSYTATAATFGLGRLGEEEAVPPVPWCPPVAPSRKPRCARPVFAARPMPYRRSTRARSRPGWKSLARAAR